jgi:G:T-mismatch repair DNA endonuclease (very short patch repair protein)
MFSPLRLCVTISSSMKDHLTGGNRENGGERLRVGLRVRLRKGRMRKDRLTKARRSSPRPARRGPRSAKRSHNLGHPTGGGLGKPLGSRERGIDRLSRQRRSWNMSRIRGKDTTPEKVVRSLLHRMGYRFRLHVRIPIPPSTLNNRRSPPRPVGRGEGSRERGKVVSRPAFYVRPDIVLRKYKTAIFVHGCFWHRHKGCKTCTMPTNRREWWLGTVRPEMDQPEFLHPF